MQVFRAITAISDEPPARQFAALCWRRRDDRVEVLLISSRETGRWIIPKGWPMKLRLPHEAAACEAWEEAGVAGEVAAPGVGTYSYLKQRDPEPPVICRVEVFAMQVRELAKRYPEVGERRRKWFAPDKAATKVHEPELAALLRQFMPPAKSGP